MLQTNASVVNLLFHVTQYVASLATESCSIRSQSALHLSYIHTWTLLWSRSIWPQSNLPKWNLMPAMYGGTAIAQLHLRSVVLPQGRGARGGWGEVNDVYLLIWSIIFRVRSSVYLPSVYTVLSFCVEPSVSEAAAAQSSFLFFFFFSPLSECEVDNPFIQSTTMCKQLRRLLFLCIFQRKPPVMKTSTAFTVSTSHSNK